MAGNSSQPIGVPSNGSTASECPALADSDDTRSTKSNILTDEDRLLIDFIFSRVCENNPLPSHGEPATKTSRGTSYGTIYSQLENSRADEEAHKDSVTYATYLSPTSKAAILLEAKENDRERKRRRKSQNKREKICSAFDLSPAIAKQIRRHGFDGFQINLHGDVVRRRSKYSARHAHAEALFFSWEVEGCARGRAAAWLRHHYAFIAHKIGAMLKAVKESFPRANPRIREKEIRETDEAPKKTTRFSPRVRTRYFSRGDPPISLRFQSHSPFRRGYEWGT